MDNRSKILKAYLQQRSVTTDTRNIESGDLFFALKGENFNGNTFAQQALEKDAALVVIDEAEFSSDDPRIVLVEDALLALQQLAFDYRNQLSIPVIGITGTNGKTTTKELVHAVLATEKKVSVTRGNLNNHIGVPLTVLSIPDDAEIAVVEMGANKAGDIKELVEIACPTVGVITNIGYAHLERFGDIEGVRRTKGEMFDYIRQTGGTAWVNADDERVLERSNQVGDIISYGTPESDYYIISAKYLAEKTELRISGPQFRSGISIISQLVGRHNAMNVLVAVLAGAEMGVSVEGIQQGIANYQPKMNRTQIVKTDKFTVMMDAYNANPSSMKAAIQSVFDLDYGKTGLILGDMFEMGEKSAALHADIGEFLKAFPVGKFVGVGVDMKNAVEACRHKVPVAWYETTEEAKSGIASEMEGMEFILLKGSRGMALEKLADALGIDLG